MENLICYCFEHTAEDIKNDYHNYGKSLIMEKLIAEKKSGGCSCAEKNPKGKWCLGDVRQVVNEAKLKNGGAINPFIN